MTGAPFEDLAPVEQVRIRRAERRSLLTTGVGFGGYMVVLFVSSYGRPGRWAHPDNGTPWGAVVVGLVATVVVVALTGVSARGRLRQPGTVRDLAASAGLRDILRVARDLGAGRPPDERSRPVARALMARIRPGVGRSLVVLVLTLVLAVVAVRLPLLAGRWFLLGLAAVYALATLGVLVWSVRARRTASAAGLTTSWRPSRR